MCFKRTCFPARVGLPHGRPFPTRAGVGLSGPWRFCFLVLDQLTEAWDHGDLHATAPSMGSGRLSPQPRPLLCSEGQGTTGWFPREPRWKMEMPVVSTLLSLFSGDKTSASPCVCLRDAERRLGVETIPPLPLILKSQLCLLYKLREICKNICKYL